jgi:UDP-3-O-[3-hydroxymyristoyl] glucosamine N-acyltransferase
MSIHFFTADLVDIVQPSRVLGETSGPVRGIASLDTAEPGDLSFLGHAKYRDAVAQCRASVLLLPANHPGEPPAGQQWLLVDNPSEALTRICRRIEVQLWPKPAAGVHPSAVVAADAAVAPTAYVGPLCVIDSGARIGERAVLHAGVHLGPRAVVGDDCWLGSHTVVAQDCVLGTRVRMQAGVVIGSDGFGYETKRGRHERIPQVGNVVLGDDVEIGANSAVDRARFSRTVIGEGTKIDNLVQIGHNCIIGRHCILCGQVGLAGSTTLGDYVVLAGQVGSAGHITIGSFSKVGGQAGLSRDLPPKSSVSGTHAIPHLLEQKFQILRERLPELFRRVDRLEAELQAMKTP